MQVQDQVESLGEANIPACFLGSAQTDRTILNRLLADEFRLVYVSPEFMANFKNSVLKEDKFTLIAVDEAHVSWHGSCRMISTIFVEEFYTIIYLFLFYVYLFSASVNGATIFAPCIEKYLKFEKLCQKYQH